MRTILSGVSKDALTACNYSYIKLIDYGARWYSQSLGRFIQPDSIIPDLTNSQAWNRFSYAFNNPINFIDPSGHVPESIENDTCIDGEICGEPLATETLLWVHYKIKIRGEWQGGDLSAVIGGVEQIASQFGRVTGKDGRAVFREMFGEMKFSYNPKLEEDGFYGKAGDGYNEYRPGKVSKRLVIHELGHSFEKHMYNQNGSVYYGTNNPVQLISAEGIYAVNGNLVTGNGLRYAGKSAPKNGYTCDAVPCQYHSIDVGDWNDPHEDWADMFMNWAFDSFASNTAGDTLYNWVDSNMGIWLP